MEDISLLPSLAKDALDQAVQYSFDQQCPDGHWVAEVSSDATFTSEYVMFKYAMGLDLDGDAIKHWLLHEQKEDGSWGLAPELPGNVSTTTEAYLALKILGVLPEEDAMVKAQHWMVRNGGVAKVRFFTRFFLATFGLFPWTAIPQLPAELILMPPSSILNIYTLSSWARSTLIPILIVAHHRPLYPLPNGLDANNNFLDELWINPADKNVPYAPPLSTLVQENEWVQLIFTAADGILGAADGLRNFPLRKVALRKCIDWLLEHQEKEGEWAGFFPPMHGSLWALVLEGYPLDHDVIQRGFAALERLAVHDTTGKRLTATVSPVWDTALMASSLCDAGLGSDGRICQAAAWLKCRQILGSKGDWRIYSPCRQAGGWSFEYHNQWYPDVDDTAVVVIALVKQDCRLIKSDTIIHAVTWIMGMQNHDGGWAAFDCYNDSLWLHKIPFSDMDSLCDPSSADITGRILECFGFLLSYKQLRGQLERRLRASSARGIAYLEKEQDKSGAWWGRWGNNYIYGTSNVLRGLHYFRKTDPRPRINKVISAAVSWFQSIQNADGGWGETLASYDMPELAGRGPSTAAQTAWALQSLLLYQPASSPSIQRGILWLVRNQTIKSSNGASWRTDVYTGTGFPKVLYLGYPFYHHAFPVMALSKFLDAQGKGALIRLPKPIMDTLSRQCVSMMVTGSRGDVEPFLRVAVCLRDLHGLRVRMATHTCHKSLVQDQGIEFYPIAGGPEVIGKALLERPSMIRAYLGGHFTAVVSAYKTMLADCWRSTMDHAQEVLSEKLQSRPFMADIIVTHRPILIHTHAAESLQVPLALLSIQPDIPTADFPHPITMTKPRYKANRWFNRITYDILDFVNLMAFGLFIDRLRVGAYKLGSKCFIASSAIPIGPEAQHLCLWSNVIVPKPDDWREHATITGYSMAQEHDDNYLPSASLLDFLSTEGPIVAVSMGSMHMENPSEFLQMLSAVLADLGARAVVSGAWTRGLPAGPQALETNIFAVEDLPHTWLLRQRAVRGFIHHGGAGHTAAGARAGVPMLVLPFFIDQNFWAAQCRRLRLGPHPVRFSDITASRLRVAVAELLSGEWDGACARIASRLAEEAGGTAVAADAIARQVQASEAAKPCSLVEGLTAQWRHRESGLLLSGLAAAALTSRKLTQWSDYDTHPVITWDRSEDFDKASGDGVLSALVHIAFKVLELLLRVLAWGEPTGVTANPIREAKIRQSSYDLDKLRNHMPVEHGGQCPMNEQQLVQNWKILVGVDC